MACTLYQLCLLKRGVGTVLVDGLERVCRKRKGDALAKLGYINTALHEVYLTALGAAGVELRGTSTVAVPSSDARSLIRYRAYFGHISLPMVP